MDRRDFDIIDIDGILVSSEIVTEFFSCDYERCKGCCCIIGESGAPLEEEEPEALETEFVYYSKYLTQLKRRIVKEGGYYEIDFDGDIVTPLVKDGEGECVYTVFDEDDNCFCAIEKSYFEGESAFRKPISCWLYPIRVEKLSNGSYALNLHKWHICSDAYAKGKREGTRVFEFVREPLIHFFGEEFYEALSSLVV